MKCGKLLLAAIAGGIYLSFGYINPWGGAIDLSEAVLQLSGSRGSFVLGFSSTELMSFSMCLFPTFLFELYTGIRLYRHFCTASTYIFSRYPRRVRWYLREAGGLGGTVCAFQLILLAAAMAVTAVRWDLRIDSGGMALLLYHFLIQSLWTYIMTLSVNLLSIYLGSGGAYASVICIQSVCIVLFYVVDQAVRHSQGLSHSMFLIWNPMAHLVLAWHSSETEAVGRALEPEYMGADLNHSLILFCILGAAVTAAGAVIIKNHELLVSDSEAEA